MGMFSWITADTNESISNSYSNRGPLPVKMLAPDGRVWTETNYEGYGVFGGKDFYALLDEMNGGDGDRDRGIELYFSKDANPVKPRLVSIDCKQSYDQTEDNEDCPNQGFFYGEDEDEDDDDDWDEEDEEWDEEDEEWDDDE